MPHTDHSLLEKVKQSDLQAYKILFEKYQPALFNYLYYKSKNYNLAQDIVQETFLKVWLNKNSIKPQLSFFSYVAKISDNLLKDYFKRIKIRERLKKNIPAINKSVNDDPELSLDFSELQNKINKIITKNLPSKCQQIFILSRIEHKSNKEIACLLNISQKTVENQLYYALKVLRNKLDTYLTD